MSDDIRYFSRRQFLAGTGIMAIGATFRFHPALVESIQAHLADVETASIPESVTPLTPARPIITVAAERAVDLMLVDFAFCGFTVDKTSSPPALVATATASSTKWVGVIVTLPPQAIAEGSYPTPPAAGSGTIPFDPTPVLSQVSGPTILAFTFAHGSRIPLPTMTVADLLDWSGWNLFVPRSAITGSGETVPIPPLGFQTQIEVPVDLFLVPVVDGQPNNLGKFSTQFVSRPEPLTSAQDVTECWSTNLVSYETLHINGGTDVFAVPPLVAAAWANDYRSTSSETLTPENYIAYYPYVNIQ